MPCPLTLVRLPALTIPPSSVSPPAVRSKEAEDVGGARQEASRQRCPVVHVRRRRRVVEWVVKMGIRWMVKRWAMGLLRGAVKALRNRPDAQVKVDLIENGSAAAAN